ncbi:Uncharacterized membrane protein YgaE, UPF0421/DUF939 family [Ignavigranum ruoffiae]|uniref:Uncharacterized membrane protein YgaE, UPF0421/DUF939 family n=1 Tax=Ignavigranum ruoffiae TaxID=89093 RepID=A0A1H9FT45_9LACT|nr:aromatic acid exporter family protein [Ignavigranum ruoffiae]SEQ40673.1 Uncharacterized membrane protein YgaE, UPF0421/DUF939 family [Ignavigranum ruoffiae]
MRIGARVLKTGLAITLSIFLSIFLIPENSAVMAAIAAVTTTAPTVKKSFEMFNRRILANIIGGVVAVLVLMILGNHPIMVGVAAVFLISILNILNLGDVLTLAVITLVAIMSSDANDLYLSAFYRVIETIIGVTVSFLVNSLIYPPRYDEKFYDMVIELNNELIVLMRAALRKNIPFTIMEKDLSWAHRASAELNDLFDMIHEEVIFPRSKRIQIGRKLVIYRHFLATTQACVHLLEMFHKHDHVYKTFPKDLQILVRERLELLLNGHEQILLKFHGRIPAEQVNFMAVDKNYRHNYIQQFYHQMLTELERDDAVYDAEINGIAHMMSAIYLYEEKIYALNHIMTIYRQRYDQEVTHNKV